jgi:hypothetical protein
MKAEMRAFILLLVTHQLSADPSKKSVLLAKAVSMSLFQQFHPIFKNKGRNTIESVLYIMGLLLYSPPMRIRESNKGG